MTTLMLTTTLGCNVGCAHCHLASNPEKLHLSMSEDEMLSYIKQAYDYGVRCINLTGGEPMLLDLKAPMLLANNLGMQIIVRTNAFWAKDYDTTLKVLLLMQFQGLVGLGLSYDNYHAKSIPPSNIVNALKASRELYLPVSLDWEGIETRKQVLEHLQISEEELRYVSPPLKVGKATELSDEHFKYVHTKDLYPWCGRGMYLTIFPGGYASLHPCCWVNPALIRKIGNNGWIKELEQEAMSSPMMNYLRKSGVRGLIEKAKDERPQLVKPYYSRHCEACYDLLGPLFPDEVQELPEYLEELRGTKSWST